MKDYIKAFTIIFGFLVALAAIVSGILVLANWVIATFGPNAFVVLFVTAAMVALAALFAIPLAEEFGEQEKDKRREAAKRRWEDG